MTGAETLTLKVFWERGHRDRIVITHEPVGSPVDMVVVGRSQNDVMKTVARFFDYDLECTEGRFIFKFHK